MPKKPETLLKEKVLRDLKTIPNIYFVKIQQVTIHGTPDILACISGFFVAIEMKKDHKTEPEPRQIYDLEKVKNARGIALIVDPLNWPGHLAYLKALSI